MCLGLEQHTLQDKKFNMVQNRELDTRKTQLADGVTGNHRMSLKCKFALLPLPQAKGQVKYKNRNSKIIFIFSTTVKQSSTRIKIHFH